MRDTLTPIKQNRNAKANPGNLTASRTVLSMHPSNQQKTRQSQGGGLRYHASEYSSCALSCVPSLQLMARDEENQDAFKHPSPEVVEIPSDEDTGEPLQRTRTTSPDPIDSIDEDDTATRHSVPESSKTERRALHFEKPKRALPQDGAFTRRLGDKIERNARQEVITIDDEDDTTEQFMTGPALVEPDVSEITPVDTTDSASASRPSSSSMNTRYTSPTVRFQLPPHLMHSIIFNASLLIGKIREKLRNG